MLALVLLVSRVLSFFDPPPAPSEPPVASSAAKPMGFLGGAGGDPDKRPDDLVAWLTPRLPGQPWTAPAYDKRPVVAQPELYCVAAEDGDCKCITEQGTRYVLDMQMCRVIAREGTYNPTRLPAVPAPSQAQPSSASAPSRSLDSAGGLGWPSGVGQRAYTPPGAPGSWHADAFGQQGSR